MAQAQYIKAYFIWISPKKKFQQSRTHIQFANYQFRPFVVPMNQQQPSSPQPPLPPVILSMQQLLAPGASSHHPRYSNPYDGPYQHQPPNSGPSRNRRKKGARKAETRYPYQMIHESSGTANYGPSTGIDSGHPWIEANNNPRIGKVWRTPSTTSLMADRDCILI